MLKPEWIPAWQPRHLYQEITHVSETMVAVGITVEELQQALVMIEAVAQKRNQALRKLDIWMRRYLKVVRLALEEDDQLLEVLGIVVKA